MRKVIVRTENFALKAPFRIAHGTRYNAEVVVVEISENNITGYGEAVPYERYNETCASVIKQIKFLEPRINLALNHKTLRDIMPHGAARNAIDCALWDLMAKKQQKPLWKIAKLPKPAPITTVFTLVIDSPNEMAQEAKEQAKTFPILKLKLAGDHTDKERIMAVHQAVPDTNIIIDANESWDKNLYLDLIQTCLESNVVMIEQPFKSYDDDILSELSKPIDICADESCHIGKNLSELVGKYNMVNIKLDKTGGLTEAISMIKKAKTLNFKVMVGCMVGTSLSMKPAYYLAQMADLVDLDGPLLLEHDRPDILQYDGSTISSYEDFS